MARKLIIGAIILILGILGFSLYLKFNKPDVVDGLTNEKQIVLLKTSIEDTVEDETALIDLPFLGTLGTQKIKSIQYQLTAKFGIDGKEVVIEEKGDNEFTIYIPQFIFIGYSDVVIYGIDENNERFSMLTKDVDEVDLMNEIFNERKQEEFIVQFNSELKEYAQEFYNGLLEDMSSSPKLNFVFSNQN